MTNLFLPPFPQEGLTQDYTDLINQIFAAISQHTHLPGNANTIQNNSINWTGILKAQSIQNLKSVSLTNLSLIPDDYTVFAYLTASNLFYKKPANPAIQITNNLYVDFNLGLTGVGGPVSEFNVIMAFNSTANAYNFTSNGQFINFFVFAINIPTINTDNISCNVLTVLNALQFSQSGYLYVNDNYTMVASDVNVFGNFSSPILLDKSTSALGLVFDNLVTYNFLPLQLGTTYPASNAIFLGTVLGRPTSPNNVLSNTGYARAPICQSPSLTDLFYWEPRNSDADGDWNASNEYTLRQATERWVYFLDLSAFSPPAYVLHSSMSRIYHACFQLYDNHVIAPFEPLPLTSWNDCLFENQYTPTPFNNRYQKIMLVDVGGTVGVPFNLKFFYFTDYF